jgi:hypothetical protein
MLGFWLAIESSSLSGFNCLSTEAGREWVEKASRSPLGEGNTGIRIRGSDTYALATLIARDVPLECEV